MEQEFTITMMHGSQFFVAVKDDINIRGNKNVNDNNIFHSITSGMVYLLNPDVPTGEIQYEAYACDTDTPKIRWTNIDDDLIDVVKPAILEVIAALKAE